MKQSGRVHWLVVCGLAGLVFLVVMFFISGSSPGVAADNFMLALAKGDVDKLTDLTYLGNSTKDEMKKKWEFSTHVAAPHYLFVWRMTDQRIQGPDQAAVSMQVTRNLGRGAYEEHFELPMIKVNGEWKVRVQGINRDMYPDLPR